MKILITGAGGGIGKKLINKLSKLKNFDLVVLSREKRENQNTSTYTTRYADLNNSKNLNNALCEIDVIIHLAAFTHSNNIKNYFKINTEGTKNLLEAAEKNFVKKFIFVSSRTASIEGGAYAYSKYLAEELVKKYKYNWIILKPSEVYGAKDSDALQGLIHKIKKSYFIPIPANCTSELSPLFINDLITAIINSINTNYNNGSYVLAGPESFLYSDLANHIAGLFKKKIKIIYIPIFILKLIAFLFPYILVNDQIPRLLCDKPKDFSLAKKNLDFNPIKIEEWIKKN